MQKCYATSVHDPQGSYLSPIGDLQGSYRGHPGVLQGFVKITDTHLTEKGVHCL